MDLQGARVIVVGSGFFGAVIAERVSRDLDLPVVVLEKREHIGGNSFSKIDPESGVEYHLYGSHIFHTSSREVWSYINQFSAFNSYQHRVLTSYRGTIYSMPINLSTINTFYRTNLTPTQAEQLLATEIARDSVANPRNMEEKGVSLIGRPLFDAFIKGYSEKQWETDLRDLPPHIITRLPVRFNYNDRYFDDEFEGLPIDGYHAIFTRMLSHRNIAVHTGVDFFALRDQIPADTLLVYTGPVDRFFEFRYGPLKWRTLRFEKETLTVEDFQGTAVMNYAEREIPYTRIHEFKHFHPERKNDSGKTLIYREFSRFATSQDEPYYPVNTESDKEIFKQYRQEMSATPNVIFGGRLATYKYLDMHQVIGAALRCYEGEIRPRLMASDENGRFSYPSRAS